MNGLITLDNENELYHFGTPRHSGRYPWGSGERPYQGDGMSRAERKEARKERVRQKNVAAGTERLTNRINRANSLAETDRYAKKIGWRNTEKSAQAHKRVKEIKNISKEILEDEQRTERLGAHTRHVRMAVTPLTVASSTAAASFGAVALASSAPLWVSVGSLAGAGALAGIGTSYLKKTRF